MLTCVYVAAILLVLQKVSGFYSYNNHRSNYLVNVISKFPDIIVGSSERRVSFSADGIGFPVDDDWLESTTFPLPNDERLAEEATEIELDKRRKQLQNRISGGGISYNFDLPLFTLDDNMQSQSTPFGFTIAQISRGRILSAYELDLDTLNFQMIPTPAEISAEESDLRLQRERIEKTKPTFLSEFEVNQSGLVVTSVIKGSPCWKKGVRPGDLVVAVSATVGDSLWPKSSLEGVKSAISSRRITLGGRDIRFEMKKMIVAAEKKDTQFELTLSRPLGFNIRDSTDKSGYVEVSSISESASNLVKYGIRVGDRIVAIESSLGDQMWPASSTLEGVISACTGRLPGQPIKIRFERLESSKKEQLKSEVALQSTVDASVTITSSEKAASGTQTIDAKELLCRCRSVLKRYAINESSEKLRNKQSLESYRSVVADKVVDALASASCEVDCLTLHMIMNAYLSGNQPEKAIRIFEASTGFAGDGSIERNPAIIFGKSNKSRVIASESSMNLYTCTALLRAHSAIGDFKSVRRVLLAMQGRSGESVGDNIETAPWPWTGSLGSLRPDTVCYNIGISCAEKTGGHEALNFALDYFRNYMVPPGCKENEQNRPIQTLVTFNTMMNALCNEGMSDDAFALFAEMKRLGLRPDKFTYTALLRACSNDVDLEEILYDMKERGVQADVVTYNTMIRLFCRERKWTQATRLISEMESRGISPDSRTYSLIMNEMLKENKTSACLALFESACGSRSTMMLTENVYLFTIAITAASKLGDHQRALEYVARMNAQGIKPNVQTLTAVIGACLATPNPVPDLAVQVFRRIEQPDAYAVSQGIRALCKVGDLEEAVGLMHLLKPGAGIRGKAIMYTYNQLLKSALDLSNYDMARTVFSDLLLNGYIPGKEIYDTFFVAFGLSGPYKKYNEVKRTEIDVPKFQFLLFVVDSLQRRQLPVTGDVFASILALGNDFGGLPRRIAALMTSKKSSKAEKEVLGANWDQQTRRLANLWEELFLKYDSYQKEDLTIENLPPLVVRVEPRNEGRVLQAELAVSFNGRQRVQSKMRNKSIQTS